MQQEFYSLPFVFEKVMRIKEPLDEKPDQKREELRQEHPKCSLEQSIKQNLHLLLTTAYGEFPAEDGYGCSIWDNDFDNLTSPHKTKEHIRQSLVQSIKEYEKRLGNVRVELLIRQEELPDGNGARVKKRIEITITGTIQLTNERFGYKDSFFIGPLSY